MSEYQAAPDHGPTAGMLLRQAREAAGLHPEALAVTMKVPVRQIEALEQDQVELLPDTVFARALAASLCRHLKIDPQPVLARLPQGKPISRPGDREPINEPFRTPGESALSAWRGRLGRPPVVVALVLLLGALILLALPLVQTGSAKLPASDSTSSPGAEVAAPAAAPGVVTESVLPPGLPAPAEGTVPASPAPPPGTSAPAGTPGAAVPAAAAQPVVAAAPADAPLMSLRVRSDSWVQVTDGRGAVPLRRLLVTGETVAVTGATPLSVTIGSASVTDVTVRGRPFDLTPVTRDNVARFEVR